MSSRQSRRAECSRCGWYDTPGHWCRRRIKLGRRTGLLISRSFSGRTFSFCWTWKGDAREFVWAPSLGSYYNHSARGRMEQAERERPDLAWED